MFASSFKLPPLSCLPAWLYFLKTEKVSYISRKNFKWEVCGKELKRRKGNVSFSKLRRQTKQRLHLPLNEVPGWSLVPLFKVWGRKKKQKKNFIFTKTWTPIKMEYKKTTKSANASRPHERQTVMWNICREDARAALSEPLSKNNPNVEVLFCV